jgi:hypothetical protein
MTSILILNNFYEDINRSFNKVQYNTLKWVEAIQLVLNVEKTKILKFTPLNFSYAPSHVTFAEHLTVEKISKSF